MGSRRPSLLALGAIVWGAAAAASDLIQGSAGGELRLPLARPASGGESTGLAFEWGSLEGEARVGARRESNVFLAEDATDDVSTTASVEGAVTREWQENSFQLAALATAVRYQEETSQDADEAGMGLGLKLESGANRWDMAVRGLVTNSRLRPDQTDRLDVVATRGRVQYQHRFETWALGFGLSRDMLAYQDDAVSDRDQTNDRLSIESLHPLTRRSRMGFRVWTGRTDHPDGAFSDSSLYGADAGILLSPSERSHLEFRLGFESMNFADSAAEDGSSVHAEATAETSRKGGERWRVNFRRTLAESIFATSGAFVDDRLTLEYRRDLGLRASVLAQAGWERLDFADAFAGDARTDTIPSANLGAEVRMSRHWGFKGLFGWAQRRSTADGLDYDSQVVTIGVYGRL